MSSKTYQFYCDHCGYKRITDGTNIGDLQEVQTSPVPRGSPKLDPQAKQIIVAGGIHQASEISTGIIVPPPIKQTKKFKCPKCGFIIKARQIKLAEYEQNKETNQSNNSLPGPVE